MIEIKEERKFNIKIECNEEELSDLLVALIYNAGDSNISSAYSKFLDNLRKEIGKIIEPIND